MAAIQRLFSKEINLAGELISFFQEEDGIQQPTIPSKAYLTALLSREDFVMLAALEEGELAGGLSAYELAGYKASRPKMFLYEIAVKPEWRRRGIGGQLVEKLLIYCRERGAEKLFVETSRAHTAAMKLFESTGGKPHPDSIAFSYPLSDY